MQEVFPPTRPPPLRLPRASIKERAEQGANFLRTYLPDIEITSELIREEIAADALLLQKFEDLDPYKGNLLAPIIHYSITSEVTAFLAFPMGELNRDLNVSPFRLSEGKPVVFAPSANPVKTFDTPIQQITASVSDRPDESSQGSFLAVRTLGSTFFFQTLPKDFVNTTTGLPLKGLAPVSSLLTGNRSTIDVKLQSTSAQAWIANDHGAVFKWSMSEGKVLGSSPSIDGPSTHSFWRLACCSNLNALFLISSRNVKLIDFRSRSDPTHYFEVHNKEQLLTSIEDASEDHIIRLGTTSEILWLDDRYPRRPLLAFRHGRQSDRTLFTQTTSIQGNPFTFLGSHKNDLLTVYDVSRAKDQRIQVNRRPYCLAVNDKLGVPYAGHAFFGRPSPVRNHVVSFYRLSESGSLHCVDLKLDGQESSDVYPSSKQWSDAMNDLAAQGSSLRPDSGPMGAQNMSRLDLRETYNAIFQDYFALAEDKTEQVQKAAEDVIDRMPSFWQESSEPVDHILTTHDIAFRTGDEPAKASRADFLTHGAVNSPSGYQALTQGLISTKSLAKDAKWHYNIAATLKHLGVDMMSDVPYADRFKPFDLSPHPDRSAFALKMESEARQQLILDLSLSTDIFSVQPFAKVMEADTEFETMSRATEALSLDGEPPPVEYSYLRPTTQDRPNEADDGEPTPLGIRLLLKEWVIGAEPENYIYKDPYDDSDTHSPPLRNTKDAASRQAEKPTMPSQRPPTVVAARSLIPTAKIQISRPTFGGSFSQSDTHRDLPASQPLDSSADIYPYTQDAMASTQVMAGPYGGRPSWPKRKSIKKRLGGF